MSIVKCVGVMQVHKCSDLAYRSPKSSWQTCTRGRPGRRLRNSCGCLRATEQQARSESVVSDVQPVAQILPAMFVAGAIMGPLLDGIHGTVHLLDYKVAAYDFAGLHSSVWVAPLLGAYYAVIGPLHILLDKLAAQSDASQDGASDFSVSGILRPIAEALRSAGNISSTRRLEESVSLPNLALNTGILALLLEVSAVLYSRNVPYLGIHAILSLLAAANWKVFDSTRQGLALALLCGFAAPLSELVLINGFGVWQYPHPDVFGPGGVPSWTFWCYFFYTPTVGNLARALHR